MSEKIMEMKEEEFKAWIRIFKSPSYLEIEIAEDELKILIEYPVVILAVSDDYNFLCKEYQKYNQWLNDVKKERKL